MTIGWGKKRDQIYVYRELLSALENNEIKGKRAHADSMAGFIVDSDEDSCVSDSAAESDESAGAKAGRLEREMEKNRKDVKNRAMTYFWGTCESF